ncbi:MAG: thioredoxin-disulfide reductase [Humidesulfovibrio sp.]|uniref:thioredoxin-disulfide reductase n=1 Tax=Humidesulfovibrio sp. TaxID=2910988 RepID=UPI0027352416|nr:thioredoxin-disulfide reductase [Humidesulfovibrio sp.]MDP2848039.1 thioredoxin-disulfide reductase [Humidesulfovibrio sp.]
MKTYDAVVIGGGPAGLTAALYLVRAGVNVALLEKLSPGGQVLMTEEIENYPGFPKPVKGYELVDKFVEHLSGYEFARHSDEVRTITAQDGGYVIQVGDDTLFSKSVVLCTGARYKRVGTPGEEKYLGRGVSYCALCDGNFFKGKTVAVIGGGNSALEESLYLARLVEKIYLIHRRDEFRGNKCYQDKCEINPKISILRSTIVDEIKGDPFKGVTAVALTDVKTGEKRELPVDGVFVFVGFEPVASFVPADLTRDKAGFVITDCEMRTNLPGFFAAGDVRSKNCRQVATAVGDGATAATAAHAYLENLNA